ncbi:hypothetical protein VTJ83DRAFT_7213 [Remersonia thermophila]|uniref:Uncharacterized protein n=1 Tax=Remersonia thermophila TaxID=72144 RepID=A0ABR4D306_9PEZI
MPLRPPARLLSGWLLLLADAAAHAPRANAHRDANAHLAAMGAVETGALLFPREYRMSPGVPIRKRQQAECAPGTHPCHDIGPAGAGICCPNSQYCIVNPADPSTAGCCAIGSRCSSPCSASQYQCSVTSTVTVAGNPQATSLAVVPACCPRACPGTSQFLCGTTPGAGCCGYGATCAPGGGSGGGSGVTGLCVPTPEPSTLPAGGGGAPTVGAPAGCETGQQACPMSLGGGCCAATQVCTLVDGTRYCADMPLDTSTSGDEDEHGSGLGGGAIAGVAVGAAAGAGVMAGVLWWACWRRRRRRRSGTGGGERAEKAHGGKSTRLTGTTNGRGDADDAAASDVASRNGRLGGPTQGYRGPAPAVGPYTETMAPDLPIDSMSPIGGVPVMPHGPGDIAAPVEIDSRVRGQGQDPGPHGWGYAGAGASMVSPTSLASDPSPPMSMPHAFGGSPHPPGHGGQAVIYELYGSEVVVDPSKSGTASSSSPR